MKETVAEPRIHIYVCSGNKLQGMERERDTVGGPVATEKGVNEGLRARRSRVCICALSAP